MDRRYSSFAEFWPFYLREHSRPRTRALHYAGTTLVVAIALFAVATQRWWLLLAIPIAGYGFAWFAHFTVEKNRPATFKYPLWSLAADFRMWALWLTGRLGAELKRAGVERTQWRFRRGRTLSLATLGRFSFARATNVLHPGCICVLRR